MPTGFTANIYDGKDESFEDFVLTCARGMGAYLMQREDSMTDKPKMRQVEPYYINSFARAERKIRVWEKMSDSDRYDQWRDYYDDTTESNEKYVEKKNALLGRYKRRLAEVEAWDVPPSLQSLKDFIIEQINSSIDFDCRGYTPAPPQDYESWVRSEEEGMQRSLDYAKEAWEKEIERVREQNEYTAALYASLGLEYGK